ncbi:MAG TPA: hypothetical protein VK897_13835 [Anaerolineales bacterium]|nr:hypothetical protein [Anaerolineales bacterium]
MYTDAIYELLKTSTFGWIIFAFAFAAFFYAFNSFASWLFGGIANIQFHKLRSSKGINTLRGKRIFLISLVKQYNTGANERLQEFRSDRLSWLWPLTVLAIPTALYGLSHLVIEDAILSLSEIGIDIQAYQVVPLSQYIQLILWPLSLYYGLRTFYRYQYERSTKNWFSKSALHNFLQSIVINTPLAYFILSLVVLWLHFSLSLYFLLSDDSVRYPILHPDLMYGLGKVYHTIIILIISIAVGSFLPTITLLREKGEKYKNNYYAFIYSGLVLLFVAIVSLVFRFDSRIAFIQQGALESVSGSLNTINLLDVGDYAAQATAYIYYFDLIKALPNDFPIPDWVNLIISVRSITLVYEIVKLVSPGTIEQSFFTKLLGSILNK